MPASACAWSSPIVAATILPASRMIAISRGALSLIVLSAVGFRCIWARVFLTDHTTVAFLLGLTGNIACGKSTVGQLLADRYGAEYVDADRLLHALYAPGTPQTQAITERFGRHLLGE